MEFDLTISKCAKIVVDDLLQASHSGEVNMPLAKGLFAEKDIFGEVGEMIARKKKGGGE